jgi:hypothetical protein
MWWVERMILCRGCADFLSVARTARCIGFDLPQQRGGSAQEEAKPGNRGGARRGASLYVVVCRRNGSLFSFQFRDASVSLPRSGPSPARASMETARPLLPPGGFATMLSLAGGREPPAFFSPAYERTGSAREQRGIQPQVP